MNRLRNRLIAAFLVATVLPLAATIWITTSLLDRSLGYATTGELDRLSRTLEATVRQFYQREREALKQDALAGRVDADDLRRGRCGRLARAVRAFWDSGEAERFGLSGPAAIISTTCGAATGRSRGVERLQPRPRAASTWRSCRPSSGRRASSWSRSRRATCGAASR